jgi:hypothetical protein
MKEAFTFKISAQLVVLVLSHTSVVQRAHANLMDSNDSSSDCVSTQASCAGSMERDEVALFHTHLEVLQIHPKSQQEAKQTENEQVTKSLITFRSMGEPMQLQTAGFLGMSWICDVVLFTGICFAVFFAMYFIVPWVFSVSKDAPL